MVISTIDIANAGKFAKTDKVTLVSLFKFSYFSKFNPIL